MAPLDVLNRVDGTKVCPWGEGHSDYADYHDREWGVPEFNDSRLYEKVCLEGFQAGLSWLTILRKRENFRTAFLNFDIEKVAGFTDADVVRLMEDAGIVRHRGKIEATIVNAQGALRVIEKYGSLSSFLWSFEPDDVKTNVVNGAQLSRSVSAESTEMSRALKKLGWKFVGPTTCYSLMQADGIVNDHLLDCYRWPEIEKQRSVLPRT
jgi:DNA-3-methyladenine glycosylase I|tara:strand:- start:6095 stop:6718 length:624 start_codon:yes stop_codon:yes gene_type:complete